MIAAAAAADPIIAMRAEALALTTIIEDWSASDEVSDAAWHRKWEIEKAVVSVRATTFPGAITSLEWALAVHLDERENGENAIDLVGSLIQGALGVLLKLDPGVTAT